MRQRAIIGRPVDAKQKRGRVRLDPVGRHPRDDAVQRRRAAIGRRVEHVEPLPQFDRAPCGELRRIGTETVRTRDAVGVGVQRFKPQERRAHAVARQPQVVYGQVLVDVIVSPAQHMRQAAGTQERVGQSERGEQRFGLDVETGQVEIGFGPAIGELPEHSQPGRSKREIMTQLDGLLFVEISGREQRDAGAIAQSGQVVHFAAQQATVSPQRFGAIILQVDVQRTAMPHYRDIAHQVARCTTRSRPQREPYVHSGQVVGQKEIALGAARVEHFILRQRFEVARDQILGRSRLAAHAQSGQPTEDDPHFRIAIGEPLCGDLDRGEITGITQPLVCRRAHVAQHGDRQFATEIVLIGTRQCDVGRLLGSNETHCIERDGDIGEIGRIERARGAG